MSPRHAAFPAVLARHGIAPDADAATLLAALAARGWETQVEELPGRPTGTTGRARFRVLALRPLPFDTNVPAYLRPGTHRHLQASGRTAAAALARVLAAVLAGEG